MGDLVRMMKATGWKVSIGIGLLLAPALAGAAPGAADVATQDVVTETVEAVAYESAGTEPVAAESALGTADNPYRGPRAEGVTASQLVAVSSETFGDTALVEILGDGSFEYAAFQLSDPARFVLDLPGVVKTTEQLSVSVEHDVVSHVRVGQYRADPDPVSRVVFDLATPAVPRIEPLPEGLAVTFDSTSMAATFPPTASGESQERLAEATPSVGVPTVESPEAEEEEPVEAEAIAEMAIPEEPLYEMPPVEVVADAVAAPEVDEAPVETPVETAIIQPMEPVSDETVVAEAVAMVTPEETVSAGESVESVEPVEARIATETAAVEPMPTPEPPSEPAVEPVLEVTAQTAIAAVIEEAPPIVEPAPFELPAEEPVARETVADAAPAPAPAEVFVEPMPQPRAAEPASRPSDAALFDVANVQVEDPASASDADEAAASFQAQEVEGERRYRGEPMDLTLHDADVKDVLRSFAQLSGLNVVVDPNVRGRVTVELVQVPWDQALEQILKINNLGYELDGNIMRIAPISTLRQEAEEQQALLRARALSVPLSTVIRRISYAKAQEIAQVLTARGGVMSNRGTVIVDRRTNTLILKELPSFMNTVIAIIENLDIPEPQVMIEARIIETTKRFSRSLGIEWNFAGVSSAATGNTTGLEFPNNGTVDGGVNLLTGADNGFLNFSLGNILDTFNLDATLNAAESEGLINVLSAPRVATLNNERASIQSGLQIPIQTVANNTVSVQFVNATLRLDVTPQVTAEGTILMDINIQKREPQLAFAVVGATNAPIATKEARTRVIVRDGGTTVIGGIYEVSTDQGEDRVPGLANVPVIKHLFKNKRRQDENEELLIFITPRVTKL